MSRDDLLADLQDERAVRPAAPHVPPRVPPASSDATTPALDVSVTPLQWSMPRLAPATHGVGLSVRVGPLQVSLGVR